jgi:hypothetical protein
MDSLRTSLFVSRQSQLLQQLADSNSPAVPTIDQTSRRTIATILPHCFPNQAIALINDRFRQVAQNGFD